MFWKVFLFEFQYRLRRPAVYVYFALSLVFVALAFANGAMPLDEGQWINGTVAIEFYFGIMSMLMMIVNSSIMGVGLHRDIEYNTRDYYFSYPITRAGYFWGRFLASFVLVILINASVLPGAWLGSILGKQTGWSSASDYGKNQLISYLYPFVTIAIPNLFFSASLFFGLVAFTKNIKVIYCAGILLFLGYMIANFFLRTSASLNVIYLADPFAVNPINYEKLRMTISQKNLQLMELKGLLLWNRVLWMGVSSVVLLFTYWRFSFQKMSSSRKLIKADEALKNIAKPSGLIHINFSGKYNLHTFLTLVKIEMTNIFRDAYFWMIVIGGGIFLGFVFSHGPANFSVPEMPRTSMILFLFNQIFLMFVFCIIVFYAGEIVHREKDTGYAIISDALPPSTNILHASKLASLFLLTLFLSITPMVIGLLVQGWMRFPFVNLRLYLTTLLGVTFLRGLTMSMLAYFLHVLINRKFVALGVAICLWLLILLAEQSGFLTYRLFLYGSIPFFAPSDLDGIGHMLRASFFINLFWILAGSILLLVAYMFYIRGFLSGVKDRLQLARERFGRSAALVFFVLIVLFLTMGAFNYYNINVKNHYYTYKEENLHAAILEKRLKHWQYLPKPGVRSLELNADLYPSKQFANFKALVTIENRGLQPIDSILLDGDNVESFQISFQDKVLPFECPVLFARGKYNLLGPSLDSSSYRIYHLPYSLKKGDSMKLVVNSFVSHEYFSNGLYGVDILHNGTFSNLGLPGLGYDDDEEMRRNDMRKKFGLPNREEEFPVGMEEAGKNQLLTGSTGITSFLLTVSTEADQTAIAPGNKIAAWKDKDRNYVKYGFNSPGAYGPFVLISARYLEKVDSVELPGGRFVGIHAFHDPSGRLNLDRFMNALKAGLLSYSKQFGNYPFSQFNLVESTIYTPGTYTTAGLETFNERFGWSARFPNNPSFDIGFYVVNHELAFQWWRSMIVPSHTRGSEVISVGIPNYVALALTEQKFGAANMGSLMESQFGEFKWGRGITVYNQRPLLKATNWYDCNQRAAIVMRGLQSLIGENQMNMALREFLDSFSFKKDPPYASCEDLYGFFKKHTPDSLQYYLRDNFENVCFYDNKVSSVRSTAIPGSKGYKVAIDFSVAKSYQDSLGRKIADVPMDDWIEIAVFGQEGTGEAHAKLLSVKKYKLRHGSQHLEVDVDDKPGMVKIDPNMRLMDLNQVDNAKGIVDR